VDVKAIR